MDRDQIIQLARDAKLLEHFECFEGSDIYAEDIRVIESFAAAIRAATKEEDAKICDELGQTAGDSESKTYAEWFSRAIRASK